MTDALPQNFAKTVPPGDDRERNVCQRCSFVDYVNPKIVVGSVAVWDNKILMCKRAIEPRSGYWTLPAGFMEEGETAEEGAMREAREEACADLEIDRILAVYSIPRISQVQIMFRANLKSPDIDVGPESAEVAFYEWGEIPWNSLAFPSVHWALNAYKETIGQSDFPPFGNPDGVDQMVR